MRSSVPSARALPRHDRTARVTACGCPPWSAQRPLMQEMSISGVAIRRGVTCADLEPACASGPRRHPLTVSELGPRPSAFCCHCLGNDRPGARPRRLTCYATPSRYRESADAATYSATEEAAPSPVRRRLRSERPGRADDSRRCGSECSAHNAILAVMSP